jgi:hypothetical protein
MYRSAVSQAMGRRSARLAYVGDGDSGRDSFISKILHHVLDEHGALSNLAICRWIASQFPAHAPQSKGELVPTSIETPSLDWRVMMEDFSAAMVMGCAESWGSGLREEDGTRKRVGEGSGRIELS